jgi:hypothetical protein
MGVRLLPPMPMVVVVQRSERSVVARVMSVRLRSITPNHSGFPLISRWRVGRVRLMAAVPKTARALTSPPGFESQTLLHSSFAHRSVGVRISPDPPRGCRLAAGCAALNHATPVRIRPALPNASRNQSDIAHPTEGRSLQREDPGSSPGGPSQICVEPRAAAGSHKPRALGSIPGHATIAHRTVCCADS